MRVFFSVTWVKWKQSVFSITLSYSSAFYSLFLPFFFLELSKFKYGKFFVRHSASISKFKWFEQPCIHLTQHLALFSKKVFHKNSLIVACCTFGLLEIRTLTPNRLTNINNDNLKLLDNNRNRLQGFIKQKLSLSIVVAF